MLVQLMQLSSSALLNKAKSCRAHTKRPSSASLPVPS